MNYYYSFALYILFHKSATDFLSWRFFLLFSYLLAKTENFEKNLLKYLDINLLLFTDENNLWYWCYIENSFRLWHLVVGSLNPAANNEKLQNLTGFSEFRSLAERGTCCDKVWTSDTFSLRILIFFLLFWFQGKPVMNLSSWKNL